MNIPIANEEENWQRASIFQIHVPRQRRLCTMIVDRGSSSYLASKEIIEKLNLKTEEDPHQLAASMAHLFGAFILSSNF